MTTRPLDHDAFVVPAGGAPDESFGDGGVFVMPGRGRAMAVLADGDGALVGGIDSHPGTGTDAVLLRFRANG